MIYRRKPSQRQKFRQSLNFKAMNLTRRSIARGFLGLHKATSRDRTLKFIPAKSPKQALCDSTKRLPDPTGCECVARSKKAPARICRYSFFRSFISFILSTIMPTTRFNTTKPTISTKLTNTTHAHAKRSTMGRTRLPKSSIIIS